MVILVLNSARSLGFASGSTVSEVIYYFLLLRGVAAGNPIVENIILADFYSVVKGYTLTVLLE